MKKVLFRDQPFYVAKYISSELNYSGSWVGVYVKRTSWLRHFKQYKYVCDSGSIGKKEANSPETMCNVLKRAYHKLYAHDQVSECIECSPEIEALYKHEIEKQK